MIGGRVLSTFDSAVSWNLFRALSTSSFRSTHIFRHVCLPPKTPDGEQQRRPEELIHFQKYEIEKIEHEEGKPLPPIKIILLEDLEGIGLQFDSVMVDRNLARNQLLPMKKACYASPFDLEFYALKKERMKEELSKRIRVPFEYTKLCRRLMASVVPLYVSMDNPWTIDSNILLASLQQAGVNACDKESIFLSAEQSLEGPNLELEAQIIRFYLVIDGQLIVPMLGRVLHISTDDTKENLYPDHSKLPSEEQLKRFGLRPESFHFQQTKLDFENICEFMAKRPSDPMVKTKK
jgi:hypothetical protein